MFSGSVIIILMCWVYRNWQLPSRIDSLMLMVLLLLLTPNITEKRTSNVQIHSKLQIQSWIKHTQEIQMTQTELASQSLDIVAQTPAEL